MNLLMLSPQSLASLTNWGLVKRAEREIQKGLGPVLEQRDAGELWGRFPDGTMTVFKASMASLSEIFCTCGAREVCRHRIAFVLAFQASDAGHSAVDSNAETSLSPWTPAQFIDDELRAQFTPRVQKQAQTLYAQGIVVELLPPDSSAHRKLCEARLPNAFIRFHIPGDLAHAQCTCSQKTRCEHIWLAIEAYKRAADPTRPQTLRLGAAQGDIHRFPALEQAMLLMADLLLAGAEQASWEAWMPRFHSTIESLKSAGYLWPASILRELSDLQLAYHQRSARYRIQTRFILITELFARARAIDAAQSPAGSSAPLPARFILGSDEAPETPLDHARLVSLGARVSGDENECEVCLYLADISSGIPLLLRKTIGPYEKPKLPYGEDTQLQRLRIAKGITLHGLAHGQIISRSLKRMADHTLDLGVRGAQHTLTSYQGDYNLLPETLLIKDFKSYEQHQNNDIPSLLKPRFRAHNVRVLSVAKAEHCAYHPGYQEIRATLLDAKGYAIELVRGHQGIAPYALDCIASVLRHPERLRFVSGELRRIEGRTVIDPYAFVTDRLIVPDVDTPEAGPREGFGDLEQWFQAAPTAPHVQALKQAQSALEELCHDGLRHPRPGQIKRLMDLGADLQSLGLGECARLIHHLGLHLERLSHRIPRGEMYQAAVEAWAYAAIRIYLSLEVL